MPVIRGTSARPWGTSARPLGNKCRPLGNKCRSFGEQVHVPWGTSARPKIDEVISGHFVCLTEPNQFVLGPFVFILPAPRGTSARPKKNE